MLSQATRRAVLAGIAVEALLLAGNAPLAAMQGAAAAAPARDHVERFASQVLATIGNTSLDRTSQIARLDGLVVQGFDLDRIARVALGRYWKAAAPEERAEFMALFKAYVLASYSRRFSEFAGRRVRVTGQKPAGEDVSIESYVEGGSSPVRLDWRASRADDGWRILDVSVEGVSLLLTYRNEFASIIERGGGRVSALLVELRARAVPAGHAAG